MKSACSQPGLGTKQGTSASSAKDRSLGGGVNSNKDTGCGGPSENGGDNEFSKERGVPFLSLCSARKPGDGGAVRSARFNSTGAFSFSESPPPAHPRFPLEGVPGVWLSSAMRWRGKPTGIAWDSAAAGTWWGAAAGAAGTAGGVVVVQGTAIPFGAVGGAVDHVVGACHWLCVCAVEPHGNTGVLMPTAAVAPLYDVALALLASDGKKSGKTKVDCCGCAGAACAIAPCVDVEAKLRAWKAAAQAAAACT
mmetsp:Transcript_55993/g.103580  ORF Transcript_55993/g.103580 Transcript_55993/m.103580 type:complete len:251 (+) Transcript_55993:664-1416(+)